MYWERLFELAPDDDDDDDDDDEDELDSPTAC
jgi:hypothetical protein